MNKYLFDEYRVDILTEKFELKIDFEPFSISTSFLAQEFVIRIGNLEFRFDIITIERRQFHKNRKII